MIFITLLLFLLNYILKIDIDRLITDKIELLVYNVTGDLTKLNGDLSARLMRAGEEKKSQRKAK